MYQALHTTLSLDDALDLIEIDDVARSWRAAEKKNADAVTKILAGGHE